MRIRDNYNKIEYEINDIIQSTGRTDTVRIIAVSKNFSAETVQEAIDSGITLFGENRIQEAKTKIPALTGEFTFHMIGHLQSNKAKEAVQLFDIIHSIDKLSTAQKVNSEAEKLNKVQKILIQVNVSGEESKSGVTAAEAPGLIKELKDLKNIQVLGLMTIGPFTDNKDIIRNVFKNTRELLHKINSIPGISLTELSMGMSSDYTIAVEEGATMVRIGSAIFGERQY